MTISRYDLSTIDAQGGDEAGNNGSGNLTQKSARS